MVAAWADGLHRALEVAERPGMAERLPELPLPREARLVLKGARIERRGAWEGALYRLATPQEPAPEGLREALGERASGGWRGCCAWAPTISRRSSAGPWTWWTACASATPSRRDRSSTRRWLRRDWGRWRRAAAPCAPRSTTWPARRPASPWPWPPPRGRAARLAPRGERRAVRGHRGPAPDHHRAVPGRGGDEAGRGERAQDGPEDRRPAEDWAPPPRPALPDAGPAAPGGEGGQREGSERDGAPSGGPSGGQAGGGSGPGALGALKVVAPSPEDRAAYWQLRGALAPEIERLIERLQAAGDRYYEPRPGASSAPGGSTATGSRPRWPGGRPSSPASCTARPRPTPSACCWTAPPRWRPTPSSCGRRPS